MNSRALLKAQLIPPVLVPDHHVLYLACSSAGEQAIKAVYGQMHVIFEGFIRFVLGA